MDVLKDSVKEITDKDKTPGDKEYNYVGVNVTGIEFSKNANVILEKGKELGFKGAHDVTFYIGTKGTDKFSYESATKIVITGVAGTVTKVTANDDGISYTVVLGTDAKSTFAVAVDAATDKVYSPLYTGTIELKNQDETVVVSMPAEQDATKQTTTDFEVAYKTNAVDVKINNSGTGAVDYKITAGADAFSLGDGPVAGAIEVTEGKAVLIAVSHIDNMRGVYFNDAGAPAVYTVYAPKGEIYVKDGFANTDSVQFLAGTTAAAEVTIAGNTETTTETKTAFVSFSKGFKAVADVELGFTDAKTYTVKAAGDVAAWTEGTLTVKGGNATLGVTGTLSFGDVVAEKDVTVDGATIYGDFKANGNVFIKEAMIVAQGGSVDADVYVGNNLAVSLTNVEAAQSGLRVVTTDEGKAWLSGAYVSGTISGTVGIAGLGNVAAGTLTVGQNAKLVIDKDLITNSDSTDSKKLIVLGTISGAGTLTGDGVYVNYVDGKAQSGHIMCADADKVSPKQAKAECISNEAGLVNAIALGFNDITTSGDIILTDDLVIPEGTIVHAGGKITVNSEVILENNGTIEFADQKVLTVNGSAAATATGAAKSGATLRNNGTIAAVEGAANGYTIAVPAGATVINDGTMDIYKVGTTGSIILGSFENNGTLNVKGDFTIGTDTEDAKDLEFQNNGKMIFGKDATDADEKFTVTVSKNATLYNSGKILAIEDAKGTYAITGKGTYYNQKDGVVGIQVNTAKIEGTAYTVDLSSDIVQSTTFMSFQQASIAADKKLTIHEGSKATFQGKLTIDGELTVKGTLIIAAGSSTAKAAELIVNGKIIVAEGGKIVLGADGASKATVAETASVTVQKDAALNIANGKASVAGDLTMEAGSSLSVASETESKLEIVGTANLNGYISGAVAISNKGTVVIDNGSNVKKASGALTINMAADGAALKIKSYLAEADLTVTDAGLVTYENSKGEKTTVPSANANVVVISANASESNVSKKVVSGELTIVESASSKAVSNQTERAQTYSMDVSGAVSGKFSFTGTAPDADKVKSTVDVKMTAGGVQYYDATAAEDDKVAKTTGGIAVSGELALGDYSKLTIDGQTADKKGAVAVSGTVTAAKYAGQISVEANGTLTVTGLVTAFQPVSKTGVVNAVYYIVKTGTGTDEKTTHNYSTLDKAIAGVLVEGNTADKDVTIMGSAVVAESVTVPAEVSVGFDDRNAKLAVGSADARDVVMTMADGAVLETIASSQVTVYGTLTFEDKTGDKTSDTVSDVMYESEAADGFRTYTNIYSALEKAGASSEATEITVTKNNGNVELDRNLTIPSNVTLVVPPQSKTGALYLKDGVTLTVDGTLKTSQDVFAETRFAINALDVAATETAPEYKSSTVVVNGVMLVEDEVVPTVPATDAGAAAPAQGIVYGSGDEKYTNLTASAPVYGAYYQIDGWYVISNVDAALKETKITSSAVTIYGPVVGSDVTVTPNDTFKTVVVSNAEVAGVGANASTVGTSLTVTSMTLAKDAVLDVDGKFTGSVVVGDASVAAVKAVGLVATNDEDALVISGNVQIAKDASLTVSAGTVVLRDLVYDSTDAKKNVPMTVAAGATAKADSNVTMDYVTVDGTLEVPANKTVTVSKTITVNGTVAVAKATDSSAAGTFVADTLYVGMVKKDYTAASAAVTGPVTVTNNAFVKADATLEQDMSGYKSTQFYNSGALWFTAYAADDATAKTVIVSKAPIENAILDGWATKEGGDVKYEADEAIAIGADSKLYSVVKTEIYNVIIKADKGISDIYIKTGSQETKLVYTQVYDGGSYYLAYTATVAAGTYTVEYKLENGWSGEAKLTGNGVSGMTFQAAGTPDDGKNIDIVLQLTGVEKSGYVEPSEPSDDKDDGMTITDYLLIVLVVLIVILAVIVALRLMRS